MAEVLLDTDVFVDHLRGARRLEMGQDRGWYSVITRCELFSGRDGRERAVEELLSPFGEIPVDRTIAVRAGRLRRSSAIRVPDALIAATALEHRLTLMTRNLSDFQQVRGLRLR